MVGQTAQESQTSQMSQAVPCPRPIGRFAFARAGCGCSHVPVAVVWGYRDLGLSGLGCCFCGRATAGYGGLRQTLGSHRQKHTHTHTHTDSCGEPRAALTARRGGGDDDDDDFQ